MLYLIHFSINLCIFSSTKIPLNCIVIYNLINLPVLVFACSTDFLYDGYKFENSFHMKAYDSGYETSVENRLYFICRSNIIFLSVFVYEECSEFSKCAVI